MKKIIKRLLIFFVGVPFVVGVIYLLPHQNFALYHFALAIVGIIASFELYNVLSQRMSVFPLKLVCTFGVLLYLTSYIIGLGLCSHRILFLVFGILFTLLLCFEIIFSFSGNFTKSISRLATGVFMLIYPWGFMLYLSAMTLFKNANIIIIVFYLMVFGCDSLAWFFGMLFGKNTRGFVKASPKKSVAGFFGGFFGSILVAFMVTYFFKNKFGHLLTEFIVIAIFTALFAILGDIVESILKRSAGLKDSGQVIMGRGGILDSIDSILLAAPVFYGCYKFLIGGI